MDAILIGDETVSGSTVSATNDGSGGCGSSTSPDVWFEYVAPIDGLATFSLCDSGYDSVIGVWDGCPGTGSIIACNDDACGTRSQLSAFVEKGNSYYVRVSGWQDNTGNFTLTASSSDGGDVTGPDVVYTDNRSITHWGEVGNIHGYSLGSFTCNIGDTDLLWSQGHTTPLLAMNAYRLNEGRLEQIGMSLVKNGTLATAGSGCGIPCNGNGGPVLGAGCLDVYGSSFNGGQNILGPRSDVNPFTGAYPGPSGGRGNAIYKRLQIHEADLGHDEALYFVEGQYVAPDDAAADNAMNNASYKQVSVSGTFDMSPIGSMYEHIPAIFAWRDHGLGIGVPDPSVEVNAVDVPDEGRFHVATKVTDLGDGIYRYDYAIRNFNSHRAAGSFSVPIPGGVTVSNTGFHDVDYHSGEPYDNTDWVVAVGDNGAVAWSSPETFDDNPDTNALRWGTMYNFWFDADAPPADTFATLGLFRPGTPGSLDIVVPAPSGGVPCPADTDDDGDVDVDDLTAVILDWGCKAPPPTCTGDVDADGDVDVDDLTDVILNWGDC